MLRLASGLRTVIGDRRGAAALEFAICGVAFLALTLFTFSLAFRLYVQVAMDYAADRAARLLAVDSTQSRSTSANQFSTVTFCPLLSALLNCAGVTIALQSVTDYRNGSTYSGTGPPPFNPGQGGSLMLLQVIYPLPSLTWPNPSGGGAGSFAGMTVSASYPYQNEY